MLHTADQHEFWDKSAEIAIEALAVGAVSLDDLRASLAERARMRPLIGELAVKRRKLSIAQVFRVLEHQASNGGMFGGLAVELGFMSEADLGELLYIQATYTPSLIDILLTNSCLTISQAEHLRNQIRVNSLDRSFNSMLAST